MIRELVFHIGDPKTGTSSIQQAMHERAWHCKSVSVAVQKELNANTLANSLRPRPKILARKRRKQELASKRRWVAETEADLGIISAEFFSFVRPRRLQRVLGKHFPDQADNTRIIAYVRPHADFIISSYAQILKCGYFPGSLAEYCVYVQEQGHLPFTPRFDRWRAVFAENFLLRPFVRSELRDGDVVADFFHAVLRGAAFELSPLPPVNESLSLEELAGIRVVQATVREEGLSSYLHIPIGGAIGWLLAGREGRSRNRLQIDQANAEQIRATFMEDAQALDAGYFGKPLFAQALDKAVEKAVPQAASLMAEDHFSEPEIRELQALTTGIAGLLKQRPTVWRRDYMRRIGQISEEDSPLPGSADREHIDAVWKLFEDVTCILAANGREDMLQEPLREKEAGH